VKETQTDHFLSEEDNAIRELDQDELFALWNLWLEQSQASNDLDQHEYSHGVFRHEPPCPIKKPNGRFQKSQPGQT